MGGAGLGVLVLRGEVRRHRGVLLVAQPLVVVDAGAAVVGGRHRPPLGDGRVDGRVDRPWARLRGRGRGAVGHAANLECVRWSQSRRSPTRATRWSASSPTGSSAGTTGSATPTSGRPTRRRGSGCCGAAGVAAAGAPRRLPVAGARRRPDAGARRALRRRRRPRRTGAGHPAGRLARWPSGVVPDDPVRAAFVDDGSFRLAATTMRLDLAGALPGEELADRVELAPMTDEESAAYVGSAVGKYAREREEAGESPAVALAAAQESFASLLPDGVRSPGQHLLTVRHDGRACGVLWVGSRWPDQAWVYDVEIDPGFRGRGLGAAALAGGRAARPPDRARLARAQRVRPQPARPPPLRAARLRGRGGAPPAGRTTGLTVHSPDPKPVEGRGRPVDARTGSVEGPVGLEGMFARTPCAGRSREDVELSHRPAACGGSGIGSEARPARRLVRRVGPVTGTAGSEGRCDRPDVTSPVTPRGS